MIGLDKRVIWQVARGHVLGEACAGIPVLVTLRRVPQRRKRPDLWRVVVIDPPRGAVLFKQLEDGGIGIRPDFDVRFTVGGRGVQEIAVGPRLPRHRAEPAVTYREIQGKLTQDGNLRRRLTEHDQRAAALGGGRCRPLTPLPPAKHGTEHATELDGDEATGLALVADHEAIVRRVPVLTTPGQPELRHDRIVRMVRAEWQNPLRLGRRAHPAPAIGARVVERAAAEQSVEIVGRMIEIPEHMIKRTVLQAQHDDVVNRHGHLTLNRRPRLPIGQRATYDAKRPA